VRERVGDVELTRVDLPIADALVASLPAERALSPVERARLATFGAESRTAEFLAGRIALRRAIAEHASIEGDRVGIATFEDGAPYAVDVTGAPLPLALSLTHARSTAIAIAAHRRWPTDAAGIGVDLVDASDAPRIRATAARSFPRPLERALALRDDRAALVAWSLKEAVGKAFRIGMLEGRGLERIEVLGIEPPRVSVDGIACPALMVVAHADGIASFACALREK
jgi:phosphopantetheinyl transferase